MYKFIHFLLTAIFTAVEVSISGIAAPFDPKPFAYPYLFFGTVLCCILLSLFWGLRTRANRNAVFYASMISALPLLGPWIAFFVLVGYTPDLPVRQLLVIHKTPPVIIHMLGNF